MAKKRFSKKLIQDIACDLDDKVYDIKKEIQKKYKLTWTEARDLVNWEFRVKMLGHPEEWLPL